MILAGATRDHRHVSDESGRWLDQHFCGRCGTNIGITLEAVPGIRTIAAGTFDDPSWLEPEKYPFRYVYLRSAQSWSNLPDGVERYEAHFRRIRASMPEVEIRPFVEPDWPQVWPIVREVVRAADTFTYDPAMTAEQAHASGSSPRPG